MGIDAKIQKGTVELFNYPVAVWDLNEKSWHHNPSICRDNKGNIWVGTRHHNEKPVVRYANTKEPYTHPASQLRIGLLDEKTLKPYGVRRMKPVKGSPRYIREKEIEDCRIFWRKDGLHGIGAAIDAHSFAGETRVYQVEILIDYKTSTYKMIKNYGYIVGHMEKNWSPPTVATPYFDYIYSSTQIVKGMKVIGSQYTGSTHGGSQVLPYKNGWIRIAHQVVNVMPITHRWYVSVAELIDKKGRVTHNSQFFDMRTGWRPQIRESVEFVSGIVWSKGKEGKELLVSYGLRDETAAFTRIPINIFKWQKFDPNVRYYGWKFSDKLPITDKYWKGKMFAGSPLHTNTMLKAGYKPIDALAGLPERRYGYWRRKLAEAI